MIVNVIFIFFDVRISNKIEMKYMPSVGDQVFIGLRQGIVTRRWWDLEQEHTSILVDFTELGKDTKENWKLLLHIFNPNEWEWNGNFTENLTYVWSNRNN